MGRCVGARRTAQKLRAPARKCAIFAQSRCPAFIFMRENTQLANGQSPQFETGGAPALSRWNRQRPRQPAQFRRLTPNEDLDLLCRAAPSSNWWPQMVVEVVGQRTQ